MPPFLQFDGQSGEHYTFHMLPLVAKLPPVPAVYVVTRWTPNIAHKHLHHVVYVGETDHLAQVFDPHALMTRFLGDHQANTICFLRVPAAEARQEIVADLRAANASECSD